MYKIIILILYGFHYTGIGICLIESSQVVVIAQYFDKKLSIANGFRVTGNSIGAIIYPFLIVFIYDTFGVTAMRLILAGIILNVLVCLAIIRPMKTHQKIQVLSYVNKLDVDHQSKSIHYKELLDILPEGKPNKKRPLDFRIFKNPVYYVFLFAICSLSLSLPTTLYYIPIYGRSVGLTPTQNSILLFAANLGDTFFRIAVGYFSNLNYFKKLHVFAFT